MKEIQLKLYRGYANDQEVIVFGHIFRSHTPTTSTMENGKLSYALAMIRMFRLNPLNNVKVTFELNDWEVSSKTTKDGYFRFNLPLKESLPSGWHPFKICCQIDGHQLEEQGELLKPYPSQLGIISDIDDTFLISYSNKVFKKLYVMLFRNVNRRKIFDDVVDHYRALSKAGQDSAEASNAFFYVSSSEWNLYSFITRFAEIHHLPKAVIKLKKIKTSLTDFLMTGRGNHDHKFIKIKDIITFYPHLDYVLLGDDSQHDPYLYERVSKHFPLNVRAIYIRQTGHRPKKKVEKVLANIQDLDVATCYFKNSQEAIAHSKKIGIV
ncbi:App1 family protein [Tunicatimonas pelagia]|uniref:App1 family protein n=1 Tax=Tunicatimonas pelagia TaxID=931531 RepID=UPI0026671CF5|nr:App1 family protein [Tunicatimonas pelagia]WKN41149.1 App1 family protein [Tunicatimonas pelagia]